MSTYRRERIPGATYFFTVTLADRRSSLLVDEIALLRQVYVEASKRMPFKTIAICALPDHLHAIWQLPEGDSDYSQHWALIKSQFSRGIPASVPASSASVRKASGKDASGSTAFATMMTSHDTSITSTTTRSNMVSWLRSGIGLIQVFIVTSSGEPCRWIGVGDVACRVGSGNSRFWWAEAHPTRYTGSTCGCR